MTSNNIIKIVYLIISIFLLNNNNAYADEKINFDKISIKEGLPHGDCITTLLLDSKDYLWIGTTDGINILDTKNNTILDLENYNREEYIKNKIVGSLFEDSEGNYYIGYLGNHGLVKLNSNEKTYKIYTYDKNNENSISSNSIFSIIEDKNKNLWVGTKSGLNKLDKKTDKFIRYTNKDGLYNDTICGILYDKVEISVTDNGIGIEKNKQVNIFDRFSQVLDMKKDALKGGSGLGLTITKQIIKKHNSIIYLESEDGKGSKFIIILPTNILK